MPPMIFLNLDFNFYSKRQVLKTLSFLQYIIHAILMTNIPFLWDISKLDTYIQNYIMAYLLWNVIQAIVKLIFIDSLILSVPQVGN